MLIALATVLVVLIGLSAIPVELRFRQSWPRQPDRVLRIRWAFGLVRINLANGYDHHDEKTRHETPRPERQVTNAKKKKRRSRLNFVAALRQKRFRRRALRFLRQSWNAVHKEDLSVRARLGLGDPADTGQLWGLIGPLAAMLHAVPNASVVVEPEFFDSVFELDAAGCVRTSPLRLFAVALPMLVSPTIWHGLISTRRPA